MARLRHAALIGWLVLAVGCTGPAAPSADGLEEIGERTLGDGTVPEPEDEPVLTVVTPRGDRVAFDLATIEQLRRVQTTVFEPFLEEDVEFSGVVLWDLLEAAGATGDSEDATLTALDDYEVELSLATLRSEPILLATRSSGDMIPVEEGGPTRVVFPAGTSQGDNSNLWIWSVEEIVVE